MYPDLTSVPRSKLLTGVWTLDVLSEWGLEILYAMPVRSLKKLDICESRNRFRLEFLIQDSVLTTLSSKYLTVWDRTRR